MSTTYETVTIRSEGFTLSRIIWRRFRRPMPGLLERTLSENAGLASAGLLLPVGTTFRLPIPQETPARVPVIRLWD